MCPPDQRIVQGLTGLAIPHYRRLTLVGDPNGGEIRGPQPCAFECSLDDVQGVVPDLDRVMFHPAGLWIDLSMLLLRAGDDLTLTAEQDEACTRDPLVDGPYIPGHC